MNKIFWFYVDMNNYHTGTTVYTFDKHPNEYLDSDDEAVPYSFEIPINYRIYIIDECPNYKIIGYIDTEKEEDCKKIYLKMFSQIYNCLPFEITDFNSAYKEEGYYPEIPDEIKNMSDIDIIEKIKEENTGDGVYFVFAIDRNGNELFTEML